MTLEIDEDYRKAMDKTVKIFVKTIPKEVNSLDIRVVGNTLQISFIPVIEKKKTNTVQTNENNNDK